MKRLLIALAFLTRLPVPRVSGGAGDFAAAVRLYPLAGLAIGALVAIMGWGLGRVDPWLGALAASATWVWATGALHLDGLADLADGLGAAHGDRTRLLAVMRDPHVGSFGVVALVLQLAAKLVLLHLLLPMHWPALLAIPAAARLGPLAWARWLPPLRPEGLGASIAGAARRRDLIGWSAVLAGASVLLPPLLCAFGLVPALTLWFRRKLGGMTGDVHGAGIELVETGLLLAFALQAA
ncbi:adenosylcobinamide-GDP ribazoletransferase [Sphingomonas aracearum]|uniref:Adenosylcobinamide-GDP ribazoletransferase n=1 Tax=Sphingomonas aracearum TaxID=2283317 RepID=A0A369VTA7_9SPHN|nr:adenosylcobinamide-GDP ribazoletransferase [Sphingomonas aracearum]RDE05646.1 adenosylcobinamide-GDP ribazoletransferase [Sphingomonas aracearum]